MLDLARVLPICGYRGLSWIYATKRQDNRELLRAPDTFPDFRVYSIQKLPDSAAAAKRNSL